MASVFKMGQRVHVLLDRIDRQQRRLQFAVVPGDGELPAEVGAADQDRCGARTDGSIVARTVRVRRGKTKSKARERTRSEGQTALGQKLHGELIPAVTAVAAAFTMS